MKYSGDKIYLDYTMDPLGSIYNALGLNTWHSYSNNEGLISKIRSRGEEINQKLQNRQME